MSRKRRARNEEESTGSTGGSSASASRVVRTLDDDDAKRLQEVLIDLGRRLSASSETEDIARALTRAVQRLVGWDSCFVQFLTRDGEAIRTVYIADTIDGKLHEFPENYRQHKHPSPTVARALHEGTFIIEAGDPWHANLEPFGDTHRMSESIVCVPIRQSGDQAIGVAAFQSYNERHFRPRLIPALELLARFCAAAVERCRAQEDVREQKERYRLVLEQAGLIPYERDLVERRYLFAAEGFEKMTGYAPEELTPAIWDQMTVAWTGHGPLANLTRHQAVEEVASGRVETWRCDMLIRRRDGEQRWLHDANIVIQNEMGKPVRSLGILQDITTRKHIETDLQKRERELRSVLSNTRDIIARFDRHTRILLVSPAVREISGKEPEELVGRTLEQIATGTELCNHLRKCVPEVLATGEEQLGELNEILDGRTRYLQCRLIPEFADSSARTPQSVLMVVQDITRLKVAQQSLHESQRHLHILIENLPAILWTVDRDLVFTLSEGAGLEAIGSESGELVGKTLMEIVDEYDPDKTPIREHHLALKGQPVGFEIRFKERSFRVTLEPLMDAEGRVDGVVGLSQDITDFKAAEEQRRRLEAQIQQTQKLESLGILAGGIAHDFNNILASILGNSSLALAEVKEGTELHDVLSNIERAGQRAADLVRQILTYAGRGRMMVSVRDLNELVHEMTELLKVSINRDARLVLELEPEPIRLEADSSQVQQVVMNLIINASEALEASPGVITIRTGCKKLETSELMAMLCGTGISGGDFVFMEVTDTGCGMTEETLRQIFDPFFTTKFTGRGLGLAAVLGIIRSHRGALQVESKPAAGSTFRVYFPLVATARPLAVPAKEQAARAQLHGTILVVDDESGVREVLGRILRDSGCEPIEAINGEQALKVMAERGESIAAVVLDLTMPVMSGEETLRRLREDFPDLPVVLMSGHFSENLGVEFESLSVQAFLRKPFRTRDVTSALSIALARVGGE